MRDFNMMPVDVKREMKKTLLIHQEMQLYIYHVIDKDLMIKKIKKIIKDFKY